MGRLTRRTIRALLSRTRWGRERQNKDPFFVTQRLVQNPAPIIFDVGAHVGDTVARYRALFPGALIHCFEPYPPSFERLVAAHRGDSRVVPHASAVGEVGGTATLHVNRSAATNSLLASDGRGGRYWGEGLFDTEGEVTVSSVALDDFCEAQRIQHIDILKIDVQGAEYAVLAGAQRLLERHAIDLVFMEVNLAPAYTGQRKYHHYFSSLDALGYELFDLFNLARHDRRLVQTDVMFVTPALLTRYENERQRESESKRR